MGRNQSHSTATPPERAILVGVDFAQSTWPLEDSLAELGRLAETDGAVVVGTLTQRLDVPVSKTFIGKGKVEELSRLVGQLDADVVIFDDELTPSQQSNLERALGEPTKVIDRTALILDIFGKHAARDVSKFSSHNSSISIHVCVACGATLYVNRREVVLALGLARVKVSSKSTDVSFESEFRVLQMSYVRSMYDVRRSRRRVGTLGYIESL